MTIDEGIIIAIIAALPGLYSIWMLRRKAEAEVISTDADAAQKFALIAEQRAAKVDELWTRVEVLERRVARYERIIDAWRIGIAKLLKQVCEAGMVPAWKPEDEMEQPNGEIPTQPRKTIGVQTDGN